MCVQSHFIDQSLFAEEWYKGTAAWRPAATTDAHGSFRENPAQLDLICSLAGGPPDDVMANLPISMPAPVNRPPQPKPVSSYAAAGSMSRQLDVLVSIWF